MTAAKRDGVQVFNEDGEIIAVFYSVKRESDRLIIDGKAMGVMRMDMIFTSAELLKAVRLAFCRGVLAYILLVPYFALRRLFRASKAGPAQQESDY